MLVVTCSMEAATSLIEDTRLSVEVETASACVAVSLSDADIWFTPLSALSSDRICASAACEHLLGHRAIIFAASVISLASLRTATRLMPFARFPLPLLAAIDILLMNRLVRLPMPQRPAPPR